MANGRGDRAVNPGDDLLLDEIHRLAMARADGSILAEDEARLEELVLENPRARELFAEYLLQSASLRTWAAAKTEVHAAKDAQASREDVHSPWVTLRRFHPRHHPLRFGATVLSLTLIFWLAFLYFVAPRQDEHPFARGDGDPVFVAELSGMFEAVWADENFAPHRGSFLVEGRKLELKQGLAEVTFRTGVRVTLQGPVSVELQGIDQLAVTKGAITARVPPGAEGFTAMAPQLSVVDLGTEFGLLVAEDGVADVHVFEGAVRLERNNGTRLVLLREGQNASVTSEGELLESQRNTADMFVRVLPSQRRRLLVPNGSFESPQLPELGSHAIGAEGWQATAQDSGVAASPGYPIVADLSEVGGTGRQFGYISGASGTLTTGTIAQVQDGQRYKLTVALGRRTEATQPGLYFIRLLVDGKDVVVSESIDGSTITPGTFRDVSIQYDGDTTDGSMLSVQLEHQVLSERIQGNFDNVRLTVREIDSHNRIPGGEE